MFWNKKTVEQQWTGITCSSCAVTQSFSSIPTSVSASLSLSLCRSFFHSFILSPSLLITTLITVYYHIELIQMRRQMNHHEQRYYDDISCSYSPVLSSNSADCFSLFKFFFFFLLGVFILEMHLNWLRLIEIRYSQSHVTLFLKPAKSTDSFLHSKPEIDDRILVFFFIQSI